MSDNKHELLELAAKAAGTRVWNDGHGTTWRVYYTDPNNGLNRYTQWSPLTDDGDAFRLAVKCKLYVFTTGEGCVGVSYPIVPYINVSQKVCDGDWYAATRLAIVRAAAEIGRKTV